MRLKYLPIVAAALSLFIGLVSWAVMSPVGSSPDDGYHLGSIYCGLGEREGLCEPSGGSALLLPPQLFDTCFLEKEATPSCQGENFGVDVKPTFEAPRLNLQTGYNPPLFYAVMSTFASPQVVPSVLAMRIFNAFLFVGLLVSLIALTGDKLRRALIVGTVATIVPLGMFIIPSTNSSSWAVIAGICTWVAVAGYLWSPPGKKRIGLGVLATVLVVMGAGSRGDAAIYVAVAVVLGIIVAWPGSVKSRSLIWPLALLIVPIISVLTTTAASIGVDGFSDGVKDLSIQEKIYLLYRNSRDILKLWTGALGGSGLGWLETLVSGVTSVGSAAVFFALIFHGLGLAGRRKMIVVAITAFLAIAMPMYVLFRTGASVGTWVQPRYILPLLGMLAGLSALAAGRRYFRLTRIQGWFVIVVLFAGNAFALSDTLLRYRYGVGNNPAPGQEWWWQGAIVPPVAVFIVGALAFGVFLYFAVSQLIKAAPDEVKIPIATN
jgi:hypothetical protein